LQKKIYKENGYTMEKDMVIKWTPLWKNYYYENGMMKTTEPKFSNNAKTYALRPSFRTHISNLFISTAYCREGIDIFSMESGSKCGKHVAYAINGSESLRPTSRGRPAIFAPFRSIDNFMFEHKLPNIGPTIIFSFIVLIIVIIIYFAYKNK